MEPPPGGEKGGAWWIIILFLESPPRRRGKAHEAQVRYSNLGITPAWAGKSPLGLFHFPIWEDHPRVGGEKR